nr:hypothetical protein Iba_chr04cCG11400 [Ipomoea batatas]GMC88821.1 hypothetical protein Iba_chr04eCG13660 [Ipomoea batatas]
MVKLSGLNQRFMLLVKRVVSTYRKSDTIRKRVRERQWQIRLNRWVLH